MQRSPGARNWRGIWLALGVAGALWLLAGAGLYGGQANAQPAAGHMDEHVAAPAAGHAGDQMAGHAAGAPVPVQVTSATTDVIVELSGFTFSPTVVTIAPGQTVTWVRRSGFHNVLADDGSYRSGDVSGDWETFSHTFTAVGESRYYCEQHGGPGGAGMAGMVIVQVSGQGERKLYLPLVGR